VRPRGFASRCSLADRINTYDYGDPAWPFGGFKQSGCGREMVKEVMEHYTKTKSVAARL
jgi:phenylacetaldehyde dehydrogenase